VTAVVRIIHTADAHGTTAVYDALAGTLDPERDLLLDAGDTLLGSNTAFRWREPNLRTLSQLGCAAMTMGNRELHYLPWVLEQRASERTFPLLAANLVDLWGRPTTWQDGVTVERDGLRIGIFGMTVVQYPVGSLYERLFGLRFVPPHTLIEHLVRRYQRDHDLVIFLSHLGLEQDRRLANQIAGKADLKLDFLLGGHTHTLFQQPETIGSCRLCHVGSHSQGYGLWSLSSPESWDYRFEPVTAPTPMVARS
jgi:2',3'-cyclic-nucleotide 2'-phosphodiesterase (5'-nucleotidase family)